MSATAFMFTHPDLLKKEIDEKDFLTIVTQILGKHYLIFGRDWFIKDQTISVLKKMPRETKVEIAQEIADIMGNEVAAPDRELNEE